MTNKKHVSYSRFSTFLKCPFQYKLAYIDKIDMFTNNEYNTFGTAMHRAVQAFVEDIYNNRLDENTYSTNISRLQKYISEESEKNKLERDAIKALEDFYFNGIHILKDLNKKRNLYFPKNMELIGNEIRLDVPLKNDIDLVGYIDTILRDPKTNKYILYDYKTSLWGWKNNKKKDDIVKWQLVLYKIFFATQHNIPLDNVDVAYVILKQNLYKKATFPQSHIAKFEPSSGSVTINKCIDSFNLFLDNILDDAFDYKKTDNSKNCKYCPYKGEYCEGA